MTDRQRSTTGRGAWLVVVLAVVAALGWWWWSGRGPAALSQLGLLPAQTVADLAPSAAASASTPAAPASAQPAPDEAAEGDAITDLTLSEPDDDPTVVSGAIALVDTGAEADAAADEADEADEVDEVDEADDEAVPEGDVAISGLPDAAADGPLKPSTIAHPLPALPADRTLEPDAVTPAVNALVPAGVAAAWLQSDHFAHRLVATVDNLGRSFAPASRWPVNPAPDRFTFEERDGRTYIAPENNKRYTPLVQLAETLDARAVVDLYVGIYPQLQAAYAELGFPDAYFNDRLMAVVDLLLASPEPSGPLEVEHTRVPNRPDPAKPWANYQFADAQLDALPAGQKIMVRVGPDNERRLKAKLAELRQELGTRVLPRQ